MIGASAKKFVVGIVFSAVVIAGFLIGRVSGYQEGVLRSSFSDAMVDSAIAAAVRGSEYSAALKVLDARIDSKLVFAHGFFEARERFPFVHYFTAFPFETDFYRPVDKLAMGQVAQYRQRNPITYEQLSGWTPEDSREAQRLAGDAVLYFTRGVVESRPAQQGVSK